MNILWLLFGGILTAVEYLISSLLLMAGRTGRDHLGGRISWVFTVDNRLRGAIMGASEICGKKEASP